MKNIRKYKAIFLILFIMFAVKLFFMRVIYNRLIDEEHFLHISHGILEAQLQRRHDINTRVISAVKKYVDIEKVIFKKLTELNGLIESDAGVALQDDLRGEIILLLNSLSVIVEAYPDLMAKGPYVFLMETMMETGRSVTEARMDYNKSVYEYNMYINILPYKMYALIHGFHKASFFEADHGAELAPEVGRI